MKTLIVSFAIWIFIVPVVVALFLIFTFLAAYSPDLYPAFASVALALSVLSVVWGFLCPDRFSVEYQLPVVPKVSATHKFNSGEKV